MNVRDISIKHKLIGIILSITAIVVVVGFSVNVFRTNAFLKGEMLDGAGLEARLIAAYCVVPLSFDDEKEVARILEGLRSLPSVESGYVYDDNGDLFAAFERTGEMLAPRLPDDRQQAFFAPGYLHIYEPIVYENKDYGTAYLRISTLALDRKITDNLIAAIVIVAILIIVSYLLALWLQSLISKPILELAEATGKVSAEGDYLVRVQRSGDDEIGSLYDGFNNMLERIRDRDESLSLSHERLEEAQRIASIGNWDWNITTNKLWWSDEIYRIFHIDPKTFEPTYEAFLDKVHPEDRQMLMTAIQGALNNGERFSIDHRIILPDGTQGVVHERGEVTFNQEGQAIRMIGTAHDITVRKRAEDDIRRRSDFQDMLVALSSRLLRARPAEVGQQLDRCLEQIGVRYVVDSISLWWRSDERDGIRSTHRWERVKGRNPPAHRDRAEYPWFAEKLRAGDSIAVDDVDAMPAEAAAEQKNFRRWGTKSFLIIPLLIDENLEGICLFSTLARKREWSTDVVAELQLVSGNLAGALARSLAMTQIEQLKDELQEENLFLREEVRAAHGFDEIVGENPQLTLSLQAVEKVAPTDITALIVGETGTGKELIARAIHNLSARRHKPMVSVNCPALPANLIESEMFGHEKGAFTGAQSLRKGRFEQANGGTLFLDELGELPLELQGKLLRVLQTGEFQRLGSNKTLRSDVRLITATNRDLQEAMEKGEFRSDLYYRISVFPIRLPALRDRKDDIPLLAAHFVRKHAARLGKDVNAISSKMIKALAEHSWPGNIRELEGVIERALIVSTGAAVLELSGALTAVPSLSATDIARSFSEGADLSAVERAHIVAVLDSTDWRVAGENGAASVLGMPPSTLRSMMKRLGISRPSS